MGSHTWKKEMTLAAQTLPEVLRALADALEGRAPARAPNRWPARPAVLPEGAIAPRSSSLHPDAASDLELMAGLSGLVGGDVRKLVLVAELKGAQSTLRIKAKRGDEVLAKPPGSGRESSQAAARKEKYRQLKKGMQADFKALERAVQEGQVPPAEVVESFLSRAEIMAEMPPGGAAAGDSAELARANAQFLTDAQALREAARKRDPAALAEVLGRLSRRRNACHAQFK